MFKQKGRPPERPPQIDARRDNFLQLLQILAAQDESLWLAENHHRLVDGNKVFVRRPQSTGVSSRAAVWPPDDDFLVHLEPGVLKTRGNVSRDVQVPARRFARLIADMPQNQANKCPGLH
jgi:hypothetical protein